MYIKWELHPFPEVVNYQWRYWQLSSKIEDLKKTGYLKSPIQTKSELEQAESLINRDFPNNNARTLLEKQDALNKLGYFKQLDDFKASLEESEKWFQLDFGDQSINTVWERIERIERYNESTENSYPLFYVQKSNLTSEYILFNNLDKPIFKGFDEFELVRAIENKLSEYDNAFLSLNGFETLEKEKSFLSTLNIRAKTQKKNIYFNKVDAGEVTNNGLLFSKRYKHKLFQEVDKSSITSIDYNGEPYFKTNISIESKSNYTWEDNIIVTKVEALAKKKQVLESLLLSVSTTFKSFTQNLSLSQFFNDFKKILKKNLDIKSEEEFILRLQSETVDLRIVKIGDDFNLQYCQN